MQCGNCVKGKFNFSLISVLVLILFLSSSVYSATLSTEQYTLLDDILDTHLNYFLSSEAVTVYGLPLGEYKAGSNRTILPWSNPTEWGYLLQAYIVAAEKGKITKADAVARITTTLNTVKTLQDTPSQIYDDGLFYPYYYVVNPSTGADVFPYHTSLIDIPSIDDGLFYMTLLIVDGWAQENGFTALSLQSKSIYSKMKFDKFIYTSGTKKYVSHIINANTKLPGTGEYDPWNIYVDEGGLMVLIEYLSGSVDFNTYKELINSQKRISASWNGFTANESAWFNNMFTWGVRSISGIPVEGTWYSKKSFVPSVKAHLAYGDMLGVDYPGFSDAMTQGYNSRYLPPNESGQLSTLTSSTPIALGHSTPHAFFIPLNVLSDLDQNTLDKLISKIVAVKNDSAKYYFGEGETHPFGFVVATSLKANDSAYGGIKPTADGKNVFETLSHAYISLSIFNALQKQDGKNDFSYYLSKIPGITSKLSETNLFLYPLSNCIDNDNDGFYSNGGVCGVVDCDDSLVTVNPTALEVCDNGKDDDCDGLVDSLDSDCSADCIVPYANIQLTSSRKFCKGNHFGASNITPIKDGLTIDCDGALISSFSVIGRKNVTIKNCYFYESGGYALTINDSSNITIQDSNFTHTFDTAVEVTSSSGVNVLNNNIKRNEYQSGVYFKNVLNSKIQGNTITTSGNNGSWPHAGAIALINSNSNQVLGNTTSENRRGLYLLNSQNNTIAANSFCGNYNLDFCDSSTGNIIYSNKVSAGESAACSLLTNQSLTCSQEFPIICSSDFGCNDSNNQTSDSCLNAGTIYSFCQHTTVHINCSSDSECDDSNPQTIDVCLNAGSENSVCQNSTIACLNDSQCNDNNSRTIDTCTNPGTVNSSCNHVAVNCFNNTDCGSDSWLGRNYCTLDNVWDAFRTFTCSNPGTASSVCLISDLNQVKITCGIGQICNNGACINPLCNSDSDCGANSTPTLSCDGNNLVESSTTFTCNNPSTINAFCTSVTGGNIIQNCLNGCSNAQCNVKCSNNSQCGQNGVIGKVCNGNYLYDTLRTFTCNNAGTANSTCSSVDANTLNQICTYGCLSGSCVAAPITCTQDSDCLTSDFNRIFDSNIPGRCINYNTYPEKMSDKLGYYYEAPMCTNPGTVESSCSELTQLFFHTIKECPYGCVGEDTCLTAPMCSNDSQCNDNNHQTADTCVNPGTVSSVCNHSQVQITCSNNSQCNDNDPNTVDTCLNSGTAQSYCTNVRPSIVCSSAAQCGANGWLGQTTCNGKNIGDYFRTYACINPGKTTSYCKVTDVLKTKSYCTNGTLCSAGVCVTPVCRSNSGCNDSNPYTQDVCINPGKLTSACTYTPIVCLSNTDCADGNTFTLDVCKNPKRTTSYCTHTPIACTDDLSCNDNNPYTLDKCSRPNTTSSKCVYTSVKCSTNTDCDDFNPETSNVCMKAGTSSSYCAYYPKIPQTIWSLSPTSGGVVFNSATCDVVTKKVCPNEMGWEGRKVTYKFVLPQGDLTDTLNLKFNVNYRNYGTSKNVLLKISAGSSSASLTTVIPSLEINKTGEFTVAIPKSYFKQGATNYIQLYGLNITPTGYGTNPPNFQINSISLNQLQ